MVSTGLFIFIYSTIFWGDAMVYLCTRGGSVVFFDGGAPVANVARVWKGADVCWIFLNLHNFVKN